jgi:hypothetical protein
MDQKSKHFFQAGKNRRKVEISDEAQAAIDSYIEYVGSQGGSCCPLNPEAQEAAPVLFGKLKDAGDGDIQRGIRIRDEEAKEWSRTKDTKSKIYDTIIKTLIPIIIGWLLYDKYIG